MSGSVSPLPWTGNKGCIYTTIDAFMPPHRTYVEACMGSAEVFLRKKPVEKEIINDYNGDLVRFFRVLQRNENLERLIGRLFLSFNSEQIFRANKALLAEVPNILDDLTETSVIIENTQWNDFDLAVAFYENQVFSFSSTGKNFAITKKDMTKRFGRLIAACARLRNATIMHRDYKDCISYDYSYVIEGDPGTLRAAAEAFSAQTGIRMRVETTSPGIQFYSGNYLTERRGKMGARYDARYGFCMETQFFPDSPNQPTFPSAILKAGESFDQTTRFLFSVE